MKKSIVVLSLLSSMLLALSAWAYPDRPIRLVVPFPAGGSTDVLARVISKSLSAQLGQQVVVDNRAGAATIIGVDTVAKAPNDGYTVLLATATSFAVNPHVYKKLPYRLDDFVPVGFIAEAPVIFVASPTVPAKTLSDLVSSLRSSKEEVAVATTGKGGFSHLTAAMFFNAIGVGFRDVPYRGEAPALQDVMGAQVNYYFGNLPGSLPYVTAGKLRAYAVTSTDRSPAAPTIPTFTELGLKDVVANAWFGLAVPKGSPDEAIAKLAQALTRALDDKEVQARLASDGAISQKMRPDEFGAYMKRDHERWGRIVRAARVENVD